VVEVLWSCQRRFRRANQKQEKAAGFASGFFDDLFYDLFKLKLFGVNIPLNEYQNSIFDHNG
jgi:hypothetical protein